MKSVVDDVLVRILLKDTISATTGQVVTTLPAREPVVSRNTRNTNINKNLDSNTNTSTHTGANKDTSAGGSMQSGIQTPAVGVGVGAGGARKRRARSNSFRNSHHHEEVVGSPMFMPADTGSSEGQVYPIPAAMPAQITAISAKGVFEHQPPCALHVDTATSHSQDLS
ncbi:hypothetical protein, variant [Sphaeroforma arctica JP610]|nr:hypothetical protein, variant [Sphaeroforma arctica JP610]KNC86065.1 hypothetical protein, variant [Sphaeroforma arctica JP610]|eukprot:XP_014159967.1 hypothetical protein, variant [Sphaeroforma arctica JP610]